FLYTPALLLVEFGRWDEILALPEPAFEAALTGALWHFARNLAFAGKGQVDEAQAERAKFLQAADSVPKSTEFGNNDAAGILAVARPYLDGRLALIAGNNAGAIASFRLAVAAEDALAYDEPPGWYLPSRTATGELLPIIGVGSWLTFNVPPNTAAATALHPVLRTFFERGGAMIDSSPMYGYSETIIGEMLAAMPHPRLFSATKIWTVGKALG